MWNNLMKIVVVDSEGDGLAYDCTKLHNLGWTEDGINYHCTSDYDEMRGILTQPDTLFACHNAVRHDLPVFNRILGINMEYTSFIDSLALSWYLHYDRLKHGLATYGEDYGVPKPEIDDWVGLTQEEYDNRVVEDVKITWLLWKDLEHKLKVLYPVKEDMLKFVEYLSFKMDCARVQEEQGVYLDVEKAQSYLDDVTKQRDEKYVQLAQAMPKVPVYSVKKYPAKPHKQDGSLSSHGIQWFSFLADRGLPPSTKADVKYVSEYVEPNPQSDPQIKDWLYSLGWEPRTFKYERNKTTGVEKMTPQIRYLKGHAQEGELCEEILELSEREPAVEVLAGLSILKHRHGFFSGFLSNHKDGKLVASIEGFTNTLRFKHRKPLANIPGVGKPWGKEIRSCLIATGDNLLCGADCVSLENMTKLHYLKPLDPEYVETQLQPGFDPHLDLAVFAGAVSQQEVDDHVSGVKSLSALRKKYKATNYSAVYGVGKDKLARETGLSVKEAKRLLEDYWKRNWAVKAFADSVEIKVTGKSMWAKNPVSGFWYQLRYAKDSFSTVNQSTGVYCFDTWLYFVMKQGITPVMQFHDEQGNYLKSDQIEENTKKLRRAIDLANGKLNLNITLDVDIKYGRSYDEVH
jgi:DNA polymerase I-like protein with 3'-5' exonuclease and polymerase domains